MELTTTPLAAVIGRMHCKNHSVETRARALEPIRLFGFREATFRFWIWRIFGDFG